jgi:protein CLEC16A
MQTLSILIQNIRNQQTIYYLFSNDHINNIAALKFDFEDDEVLGYYVNLLKTISFRLNETTVQFFFRSGGGGSSGDGSTTPTSGPGTPSSTMLAASFPLYTEAVKFVAHRDGMVRAAVKTLTLNVFAIDLPSLRNFLSSPPADIFFDHLANYTVQRCTALDRLLSSWDATAPRMAATVETYLAEIEDILTFCNDVFAVGVPSISSRLLGHLWRQVVGPVLFWPLLGEDTTPTNASSNGGGDGEASRKRLVGPLCSLYALERAIYAVTDPLLSSLLVSVLLGGPAEADAKTLASSLQTIAGTGTTPATATTTITASDLLKGLHADSKTYRASVLSMLRGGDAQLAAAVIRLLAAVLNRKSISEETIEAVGLLPRRRRKQRKLIEELTRDASSCDITTLPERSQINGTSSTTAVATAAEKEKDSEEEEDPFPQRSTSPSRISGLRRYSPTDD